MMNEDPDEIAAAYALGTTRGVARQEVESRLRLDPALQAKAERWQCRFAALDLAAPREAPPAELFDKIVQSIGTGERELTGTFTRRAGSGIWTEMAPGLTYTVLFEDPIAKRRSILLRAQPGATYESHHHDEGYEECLVLEGDLVMGDLRLLPGDFHLAAKGSAHPNATTLSGCLLYLSMPF
jgi:anti-sigma factor ChrR (cupin superfamily)